MNSVPDSSVKPNLLRFSYLQIALILSVAIVLIWSFYGGLEYMVDKWASSEEYGHGYMIPLIAAFFVWQKKNELEAVEFKGTIAGVMLVLFGGFLLVLGELSALYIVVQYAFLVSLFGVILSITGWRAFKLIFPALCILVFMIPLPNFLYQGLSAELQLISSRIGVEVIRLFDISVYLEGNVIDLGAFKLQVVEACSGLRYLFPLAALSYMSAYLFKGEMWKKVIIFISSVPITVFMNSFRIGMIGVLVEYWGIEMAEGFLHDFEGWFVFMACMVLLVLEMWVLSKIGGNKVAFSEVFGLALPEDVEGEIKHRKLPMAFKLAIPMVLLMALIPFMVEDRKEITPDRHSFNEFPLVLSGWEGQREAIEPKVIDALKFDDYIMANYVNAAKDTVNFYVAYYASQRKGASIHSPRSCIPGGGWKIEEHLVKDLTLENGSALSVNRLYIVNGEARQLVYYWFDQRGRNMTNEYVIKWYLFWDSLTRSRTDGALVRVTTNVRPGDDLAKADELLMRFVNDTSELVEDYIPD